MWRHNLALSSGVLKWCCHPGCHLDIVLCCHLVLSFGLPSGLLSRMSWGIVIWCSHLGYHVVWSSELSFDVVIRRCRPMLSSDVFIWCFYLVLSFGLSWDVVIWCSQLGCHLGCHPGCHLVLLSGVVILCWYLMLCFGFIIWCWHLDFHVVFTSCSVVI
jgi:hypothetical protein